jgi:hypothetical protein
MIVIAKSASDEATQSRHSGMARRARPGMTE